MEEAGTAFIQCEVLRTAMAAYLVTGAARFIAATVVRELLRRGDFVVGLDYLDSVCNATTAAEAATEGVAGGALV